MNIWDLASILCIPILGIWPQRDVYEIKNHAAKVIILMRQNLQCLASLVEDINYHHDYG